MPNEGENQLYFKNWAHTQRSPFVIYADFECILEQVLADETAVGRNSHTNREREHRPVAVGLKLVSSRPAFQMPYEVIAQDRADDPEPVAEKFLRRLLQLEEILLEQLCSSDLLTMSQAEQAKHDAADHCYLCKQRFDDAIAAVDQTWQKVRDHDHYTGRYRGAAHSYCNLQLRRQIKILMFLHNFRGYDSHLIVAAMGKVKDPAHPIRVIGQGLERYLQLCWGKI